MLNGTIATAFHDQCSNELWETLSWLGEQPETRHTRNLERQIVRELEIREARRQALVDTWG